jgi:hypothetical protein
LEIEFRLTNEELVLGADPPQEIVGSF